MAVSPKLTKPDDLPEPVAEIWDALADSVPGLAPAMAEIFSDFCYCLADLATERAELRREGTIIRGPNGRVKNARMQAVRELRQAVQKYAVEFGLTPKAAMRLGALQGPQLAPGDEVLDGNWQPEPDDDTVIH